MLQHAGARAASRQFHRAKARAQSSIELKKASARSAAQETTRDYLNRVGFGDPDQGEGLQAELHVTVQRHLEWDGHTQYVVRCRLDFSDDVSPSIDWFCWKRLLNLRDDLHDKVKEDLGSSYAKHFGDTPFAKFGAPPGTTERLDGWMESLAKCVNSRSLPADTLAFVLRFLELPWQVGRRPQSAHSAGRQAGYHAGA
eukprot:TRINITY_DN81202_c0_g1_i1.p1 TRINITY_DN81202_c0_g1~~TRINITY_DN81202_c0_g1_i1.p1  ORF type:complete len:206 (+),score=46.30 TRINITY_DN81202_c0_g1_i1:26-619(+)